MFRATLMHLKKHTKRVWKNSKSRGTATEWPRVFELSCVVLLYIRDTSKIKTYQQRNTTRLKWTKEVQNQTRLFSENALHPFLEDLYIPTYSYLILPSLGFCYSTSCKSQRNFKNVSTGINDKFGKFEVPIPFFPLHMLNRGSSVVW